MKNRNSAIALIVGILFGGVAFYLLYQKAVEVEQKSTPVQVLMAIRYIPAGSFLNGDSVEKKTIPEAFLSPGAIHGLPEVEGLVSLVPISSGEQILSNKFGAGEESLAFNLNPGYRAYTLEVNETSGIGNLIRPGNHVDILAKITSNKQEKTSFVFQNMQVLAVGQKLDLTKRSKKNQPGGSSESADNNSGYSTVTLAVTPEQAEILMYLEGQPLRLILRSPTDDEIVSIPSQSESEVMAKLGHFTSKTQSRHIEIIHGNSKGE